MVQLQVVRCPGPRGTPSRSYLQLGLLILWGAVAFARSAEAAPVRLGLDAARGLDGSAPGVAKYVEIRPLLRGPERIYGAVAGEADASAVIQNPANLSFLSGFDVTIDGSFQSSSANRKGSGVGTFIGFPLPFRLMAMGVGLQWTWRRFDRADQSEPHADQPFAELSFGFALPLEPWVPGLSIGLTVAHMIGPQNNAVDGQTVLDLGVTWRANRYLAMGLAARHLNQPRVVAGKAHPIELQPEIAFRPLSGRGARQIGLELAFGARLDFSGGESSVTPHVFHPVARMQLRLGALRLYLAGEGLTERVDPKNDGDQPEDVRYRSFRMSGGLEFFASRFAIAGGPTVKISNAGGAQPLSAVGGSGRLRFSQHEFVPAIKPRPRRVTRFVLLEYGGDRGLWRLIQEIEELAVAGASILLIETRGHRFKYPQLEELREALFRFRDGGRRKVIAYMDGGRLSDYFVGSAADLIIAHPTTALALTGMVEHTYYYGDLLKKLGVRSETVQVGKFKGQPEVLAAAEPSEPVAAQRSQLLVDRWNHVLREIARERGVGARRVARWVDAAPLVPGKARDLAIVDALADHDEIDERVEAWLGRTVRIQRAPRRKLREDDYGRPLQIAMIHLSGEIVDGDSSEHIAFGSERVGAVSTVRQLVELRESPLVRAVVLRIDSPGGSTWAARSIERELRRLAAVKPVVVSLGSRATSAAFYISTAADYVFSDAMTVAGSIGAFHTRLDLSGALAKVGIGVDVRGLGRNSRMNNWCRPHVPSEREAALQQLQAFYDEFVGRVADARALDRKKVEELAGGRSFSGVRALEMGLVDRYGGMREAVLWARRAVGNHAEYVEVLTYPKPARGVLRFREFLAERILDSTAGSGGRALLDLLSTGPLARVLRKLPVSIWACGSDSSLAMDYAMTEYE